MSNPKSDDLEAVRLVVGTLEPFEKDDRERILRWVREKLGMFPTPQPTSPRSESVTPHTVSASQQLSTDRQPTAKDIHTFISSKSPSNDSQFVATVAYFYKFEAQEEERKESIGANELLDACRKAPWKRPSRPRQTLINAEKAGYLDKASTRGEYRLNSVGENLVALVLPGKPEPSPRKKGRRSVRSTKATKNAKRS